MTSRVRSVHFHRLYALVDARQQYVDPIDWVGVMEALADVSIADSTIDDVIFQPAVIDGVAVLGMHRPINTDFLSRYDPQTKKLTDVLADEEAAVTEFATSTAIGFSKLGNAFGVALGDTRALRAASVVKFVARHQPLGAGCHWKVEPVMDAGRVKQFMGSAGASSFSTRFTTARDLMDTDYDIADAGVIGYAERMAETIGHDLEVEISVKLTGGKGSAVSRGHLKEFLIRDLPVLARNGGSRTYAKTDVGSGVFENLNLVASSLTQEIELEEGQTKSGLFSDLLAAVSVAVAEMDTTIEELLEG